jgi:LysM repeat protein
MRRNMTKPHKIIASLVGIVVIGASCWAIYQLYVHPQLALHAEQRRLEREAAKLAETPTDPSEAAFNAASEQARTAGPAAARQIWRQFLENYPDSPRAGEARAVLSPLNLAALFSPEPTENKITHVVAKGDSLYKIARQNGVTIDLLARANNLQGTMLQIGQELVVPKTDIALIVDRPAMKLRLDDHGAFLCEFPLLSASLPALPEGIAGQSNVVDTPVEADGKRVTYGQKNYQEGRRMIILSPPGEMISGAPAETTTDRMPGGLVVKDADMAEIFVLLRRGVPVTIK